MKDKELQKIREEVRDLIEKLVVDLGDADYLDVLEEIEADINGMIECKKEETAE